MDALHDAFEEEVRRVARLLWLEAALQGSIELDGRERDGVFETKDTVNIIEATVSKRKEKAEDDAKKTAQLVSKLQQGTLKHCKGWLITQEEPTIDQKNALKKYANRVQIISFDQFRSFLFNGFDYLKARERYRFGSVADIKTGNIHAPASQYIHMDFHSLTSQELISFEKLSSDTVGKNKKFVLIGEYGSGKSISLREIFFKLRDRYNTSKTARLPIYLNLRDHAGQRSTQEALERHARDIGYKDSAADLVRAWRAGLADLILDGFDEMASTGWGGSLQKVRTHRKVALRLVRDFIHETPSNSLIIVAGRQNFFDTTKELKDALEISDDFEIIETTELSEEQAQKYLAKHGKNISLPDWLPAKPLLIGYLASRGLLKSSDATAPSVSRSEGWDQLLTMICRREAEQDNRLEEESVRQVIERLATLARSKENGLGRLDIVTIQETFKEIVGFAPDEAAQQFILRLPGLGPSASDDSTRTFVDPIIADAARAGDIIRFIDSPYTASTSGFREATSPIGELAKEMVSDHLAKPSFPVGRVENALKTASEKFDLGQLSMDIVGATLKTNLGELNVAADVNEAVEEEMRFEDNQTRIPKIIFNNCLISHLAVDSEYNLKAFPQFNQCVLGQFSSSLPKPSEIHQLKSCDFGEVSNELETSAGILNSDLPDAIRALLSILRKLFLQPGSGRQEGAFYRGKIDHRVRKMIPDLLDIAERHKLATPVTLRGRTIWMPNRAETGRVRRILASPVHSRDPVVEDARNL